MTTEELEDCERYNRTANKLIRTFVVCSIGGIASIVVAVYFLGEQMYYLAATIFAIGVDSLSYAFINNDQAFWKNNREWSERLAEINAKYDKGLADLTSGK